jgi:hypothetical protein
MDLTRVAWWRLWIPKNHSVVLHHVLFLLWGSSCFCCVARCGKGDHSLVVVVVVVV